MEDKRIKVFLGSAALTFRSRFDGFHTDPNSPYRDKYDYVQEENEVQSILDRKEQPSEAEMLRIEEYEARVHVLKLRVIQYLKDNKLLQQRATPKSINLDDYIITANRRMDITRKNHGKLKSDGLNGVYLHTGEASDLLLGRYTVTDESQRINVSAIQAAHNIGKLFFGNKPENPYVDQVLLSLETQYETVRKLVDVKIEVIGERMAKDSDNGFVYNKLVSTKETFHPAEFSCPYAVQYIRLIHRFDELNRLMLSLSYQGDLSRHELHLGRHEVMSKIRNLFKEVIVQTKLMTKKDFNKKLTYFHWLNADDAMIKTLSEIANAGFNFVDDSVLTKKRKPAYSLGLAEHNFTEEQIEKLLEVNKRIREYSTANHMIEKASGK